MNLSLTYPPAPPRPCAVVLRAAPLCPPPVPACRSPELPRPSACGPRVPLPALCCAPARTFDRCSTPHPAPLTTGSSRAGLPLRQLLHVPPRPSDGRLLPMPLRAPSSTSERATKVSWWMELVGFHLIVSSTSKQSLWYCNSFPIPACLVLDPIQCQALKYRHPNGPQDIFLPIYACFFSEQSFDSMGSTFFYLL
jgi:hypothetical protein